jgi:hypothetical protein
MGKTKSRWCARHDNKVREGNYFAAGQWHALGETWSEPLKLVATNAWWLAEVTLMDLAAFDRVYSAEVKGRPTLDKVSLLRLWVAAYIKEFGSIEMWLLMTEDARGVSAGARPWDGPQWHQAIVSVTAASDGKSTLLGTPTKHSGLKEFFARALGLEEMSVTPPAKRSRNEEHQVQIDATPDVWDEFLKIEVNDVPIPKTTTDFTDALARLDGFFKHFPAQLLPQKTRASSKEHLVRKCVIRKFAWSMLQKMPRDVARTLTWGGVGAAIPHANRHMSCLFEGDASLGQIEDKLGMCPLLVSAWCCLVKGLPHKFVDQHMAAPSIRIMEAIEKLRAESGKPAEWHALMKALD